MSAQSYLHGFTGVLGQGEEELCGEVVLAQEDISHFVVPDQLAAEEVKDRLREGPEQGFQAGRKKFHTVISFCVGLG
jgi:hypothetical protein